MHRGRRQVERVCMGISSFGHGLYDSQGWASYAPGRKMPLASSPATSRASTNWTGRAAENE